MTIHATAHVAPGAELADDVEIGPYCIVGGEVKLGAGVRLRSHVVIEGQTEIGAGCEIYPFVMLGGEPQHAGHRPGDPCRLVIGERNLIREHVTMHGGSTFGRGVTRVGNDNAFYVGAHVGHDCIVGNHVTLTNGATLGGHVVVSDFVIMGGLAAVLQRCRIGRYAFIGGLAGVVGDVIPYGMVWGNHARLEGLNLVGLKRKGFSRDAINTLRAAQKDLFSGDGLFKERIDSVAAAYAASPEAMEIVAFIRAEPGRPLTMAAANLGG